MGTSSSPSGDTLTVSTGDLNKAAQTLRRINSDTNTAYQNSYNQLLSSISLLPGTLQNWVIDNLHTWNKYIENQVFNGNDQIANALDSAANAYELTEKDTADMFNPR